MPVLPSREVIAEFYAKYNESYSGGGTSDGKNQSRYADRYLRLLERLGRGSTLIDVGSATNPFPNFALSAGKKVVVLDFSRPSMLSDDVVFVEGSLNEPDVLSGSSEYFDNVSAWAVMEHLPDPKSSALVLVRLCKPGGRIFLSMPEAGTRLTRYSIGRSRWFYPPEHLTLTSPVAVRRLFGELGCRLIEEGRMELSPVRYVVRYGIGVAEACIGFCFQKISPGRWDKLRSERQHYFQGIVYFVFERSDNVR